MDKVADNIGNTGMKQKTDGCEWTKELTILATLAWNRKHMGVNGQRSWQYWQHRHETENTWVWTDKGAENIGNTSMKQKTHEYERTKELTILATPAWNRKQMGVNGQRSWQYWQHVPAWNRKQMGMNGQKSWQYWQHKHETENRHVNLMDVTNLVHSEGCYMTLVGIISLVFTCMPGDL